MGIARFGLADIHAALVEPGFLEDIPVRAVSWSVRIVRRGPEIERRLYVLEKAHRAESVGGQACDRVRSGGCEERAAVVLVLIIVHLVVRVGVAFAVPAGIL